MKIQKLSEKGINFLKCYETLHDGDLHTIGLQPKLDAANIWTEGYGHAMTRNGKFMTIKDYPTLNKVLPYATISSDNEAIIMLKKDVSAREIQVSSWLKVNLTQNQFDAVFLHTYNCGKSDTLYSLVNSNNISALKEFWLNHYITSQGVYLKGLKLRRMDEWEVWSKSEYLRNYDLNRIL